MKRNIFIIILFLFAFFGFKYEVKAEESYAKCWYSITGEGNLSSDNRITVYLEAKNGKVTSDIKKHEDLTSYGGVYVSASFVTNPSFAGMKHEGKLVCPDIFYTATASSGGRGASYSYKLSFYAEDLPESATVFRKKMIFYKDPEIRNIEGNTDDSKSRSCSYYKAGESSPELIIDVDNNGNIIFTNGAVAGTDFDSSLFANSCPGAVWIKYPIRQGGTTYGETKIFTKNEQKSEKLTYYASDLTADGGTTESGDSFDSSIPDIDISVGDPMTCESLRATNTYKIARNIFTWIQIAAPIMLVVFGIIDFMKAVAASDNDAMKKAQSTFVKRVIVVVIIILLPYILDLLLSLLDMAMGNDISTCNIGR